MEANRNQKAESVMQGWERTPQVEIGIKELPSTRHGRFKLMAIEQKCVNNFSQHVLVRS